MTDQKRLQVNYCDLLAGQQSKVFSSDLNFIDVTVPVNVLALILDWKSSVSYRKKRETISRSTSVTCITPLRSGVCVFQIKLQGQKNCNESLSKKPDYRTDTRKGAETPVSMNFSTICIQHGSHNS